MQLDRRAFLSATSSAAVLCATPTAHAGTRLSAEARRTGADALELRWTDAGGPVRVLASSDPDAPAGLMREVAPRVRTNGIAAQFAASPRPYFLLQGRQGEARVAERLLPLQGGRNFRDLGGYRSDDGRQVRWGRIYRSGVMAGLTADDLIYLAGLGLETVCDLRAVDERTREPSPFAAASGVSVIATDYELDRADMAALFSATSREQALATFAQSYARFAETLAPQFTDVFQRLLARQTPLAFNCSAGKDRTGMLSALILSVLGVDREVVIADYALSEVYVPPDTYLAAVRGEGPAASTLGSAERSAFSRMPEPVARVILGTPPEVMRQTLARLDAEHSGPIAFVQARCGLTDADIKHLRTIYLT